MAKRLGQALSIVGMGTTFLIWLALITEGPQPFDGAMLALFGLATIPWGLGVLFGYVVGGPDFLKK